jgi:hypothetical protein
LLVDFNSEDFEDYDEGDEDDDDDDIDDANVESSSTQQKPPEVRCQLTNSVQHSISNLVDSVNNSEPCFSQYLNKYIVCHR